MKKLAALVVLGLFICTTAQAGGLSWLTKDTGVGVGITTLADTSSTEGIYVEKFLRLDDFWMVEVWHQTSDMSENLTGFGVHRTVWMSPNIDLTAGFGMGIRNFMVEYTDVGGFTTFGAHIKDTYRLGVRAYWDLRDVRSRPYPEISIQAGFLLNWDEYVPGI